MFNTHAPRQTANEYHDLILSEIQPGDFMSAISLGAVNVEGKLAKCGFVSYGEECSECGGEAGKLWVCVLW